MILLQQMAALFVLMLIGYFCGKKGVLDSVTTKKISWLVVNVANVAMILKAGTDHGQDVPKENLLLVGGISLGMYAFLILFGLLLPKLLGVAKEDYGIYRVMLIFSNIGFMGMPLLLAVCGPKGVLYAALFQFPFNILLYTYGIGIIGCEEGKKAGIQWKNMANAGVVACVISLILFFGKVDLPDFMDTILTNLSNLTAPLSMLVIGQSFTEFRLKDLFTDVRLLIFTGIKLLLIPIAGLFFLKLFTADETILMVCLVMLSTPVASMSAMLAQQYDGDYELAAKGVALTTVLSVATIPLVSMIVGL